LVYFPFYNITVELSDQNLSNFLKFNSICRSFFSGYFYTFFFVQGNIQIQILYCKGRCGRMVVGFITCNQCPSPCTNVASLNPAHGEVYVMQHYVIYIVCQWLAAGGWLSPGTQISSTNKTDRHDITKILLKVALNTITLTKWHHDQMMQTWEHQDPVDQLVVKF
jgi:hypothetical protein